MSTVKSTEFLSSNRLNTPFYSVLYADDVIVMEETRAEVVWTTFSFLKADLYWSTESKCKRRKYKVHAFSGFQTWD